MEQFTPRGRITSLFGVQLPPKKHRIVGKYLTIRFVLTGTIPSKKNRQRAASNYPILRGMLAKLPSAAACVAKLNQSLRIFIKRSKEFEDWQNKAKDIIGEQAAHWSAKYERYGLIYPIERASMKIYHYWADDRTRDNSGKLDSIQDMLVEAGIISDDTWQVLHTVESAAEGYFGEILEHITTVDITFAAEKAPV
jgi:hypothetical protein